MPYKWLEAYRGQGGGAQVEPTPVAPFAGGLPKKKKNILRGAIDFYSGQRGRAAGRAGERTAAFDELLGDPTLGADQYLKYYQEAARGALAPAYREFANVTGRAGASIASRFGGNASSEEERITGNIADVFGRNVSETLAQLGPQAAAAGMQRAGILDRAQESAVAQMTDLDKMILAYIASMKEGGGLNLGKIFGTLAGGTAGFFLGGPAGATAGASVGQGAFS